MRINCVHDILIVTPMFPRKKQERARAELVAFVVEEDGVGFGLAAFHRDF